MSDSTCRWPECDNHTYGRGFCKPHHHKSWRVGHVDEPWLIYAGRAAKRADTQAAKHCKWPECGTSKLKGHGLCLAHYRKAEVLGDMTEPWKLWRPPITCAKCGESVKSRVHNQRFCSDACRFADYQARNYRRILIRQREHSRRRHAQKRSTQIEKFTDLDVRLASGDVCYICGERINFKLKFPHPKAPSLDHVIPLSRGGSHTVANAAMVHYRCNLKKGARGVPQLPQQTMLAI